MALATAVVGAPSAGARWSRPVRLAAPQAADVLPAQIAFSPTGEAAISFAVQNEENPAVSRAFTILRFPSGRLGRADRVPGSLQILGLTFLSSTLELLTGSAPSGRSCCASVAAVRSTDGTRFGRPETLVKGLTGFTDGQLAAVGGGRLLAAVATQRGVWVAQSNTSGRFGSASPLAFAGSPAALAATPLPSGGGGLVAWTVASKSPAALPRRILVAAGSAARAPVEPHAVVAVPVGHSIDELAVAPGLRGTTLAWVESWYGSNGALHSVVRVRDLDVSGGRLARSGPVLTISSSRSLASNLTFAGDRGGDQVVSWEACGATGLCTAIATPRPAHRRFGGPERLGAIDSDSAPAADISPRGTALVGWIDGGHVFAAACRVARGGFGRPARVSDTLYASDETIAFNPAGGALAAWTQGRFAPDLVGSWFSG